jgi:hypothetical protein
MCSPQAPNPLQMIPFATDIIMGDLSLSAKGNLSIQPTGALLSGVMASVILLADTIVGVFGHASEYVDIYIGISIEICCCCCCCCCFQEDRCQAVLCFFLPDKYKPVHPKIFSFTFWWEPKNTSHQKNTYVSGLFLAQVCSFIKPST